MFTVCLYNDITDFDRQTWNTLASNAPIYYNYEWFHIFQGILGEKTVYFAAYLDDRLVAVLPAFVVTDPKTYTYHNLRGPLFDRYDLNQLLHDLTFRLHAEKALDHAVNVLDFFVRLNHWWLNRLFFPNLTFVSPIGYVSDLLLDDSLKDPSLAMEAILAAADDFCQQQSINVQGFLWLPERQSFLIAELQRLGFDQIFADLEFNMPIAWRSFDDYLQAMRSRKRIQIKHEMQCTERHGVQITECLDFDAACHDVGELGANVQNKYGLYDYDAQALKQRYANVYHSFNGNVRVLLARQDQKLVAFLMTLSKNGVHYPKFIGFDYEACDGTFTYFNLVFYKTIEAAILDGATEVRYSMASGSAKMQRGCEKAAVYCFYRFRNGRIRRLLMPYFRLYDQIKRDYFDVMYPYPSLWR